MQYRGSKNKIASQLLPVILEDRMPGQYYVEPFMGGGNMIDKVEGLRIGNDLNYHLIEMWKALQNGWIPPDNISEEEYNYLKHTQDIEDPALVAFAGFCCSFSGKFFRGFARDKDYVNYALRGKNALLKQLPNMLSVNLFSIDYQALHIPPRSIIYCDPPYRGTEGYKMPIKESDKEYRLTGLGVIFDHEIFWEWCRQKSREGHKVYISEYSAPDDFLCIKSIEHYTPMAKKEKGKRIEKLFIFEEQL